MNISPCIKRISFRWELCDADGYPWACDIHYEIDERVNQVFAYGVKFHYGAGRKGLMGIKEVLQEIVEDLEGRCEFMEEPTVE